MSLSSAPPELRSARLLLRAPSPALAPAVLDFELRNRLHLAPWSPRPAADYFEPAAVHQRLTRAAQEQDEDQALRYWLARPEEPTRLIGQASLTQISRGPFQNAMLGYSLDALAQGQGLMTEALRCLIALAFCAPVRLHRLQAAVRPDNPASRAVLHRLGFVQEGLSLRYLYIDGAWRDHQIFALLNPGWDDTEAP